MAGQTIALTKQQQRLIDTLVATGRYRSAQEVVQAGLSMLEEQEENNARKVVTLRAEIQIGIDAIERGDYTQFPTAQELREYLESLTKDALEENKGNNS